MKKLSIISILLAGLTSALAVYAQEENQMIEPVVNITPDMPQESPAHALSLPQPPKEIKAHDIKAVDLKTTPTHNTMKKETSTKKMAADNSKKPFDKMSEEEQIRYLERKIQKLRKKSHETRAKIHGLENQLSRLKQEVKDLKENLKEEKEQDNE